MDDFIDVSSPRERVSLIERYATDLTKKTYYTDPAIARDEELKQMMLTLFTPEKSPILVGKPGIGKTAIVEGLAYRIQRNEVPEALQGYTIYRVNTTALINTNGEENRVLKLVEESKFPIILLSSRDRISRILLSRIKTIIKFPIDDSGQRFQCAGDAIAVFFLHIAHPFAKNSFVRHAACSRTSGAEASSQQMPSMWRNQVSWRLA